MNVKIISLKSIFLLIVYVAGSLTRPMTEDPRFGCQWRGGGMGSALECDCQPDAEVFHLQENSIHAIDLNAIHLMNCNAVIFDNNAIRTIRGLRQVSLTNIKNLTFEESGLSWEGYVSNTDLNTPTLRISIRDSYVERISNYNFMGRISQITFENVVVTNVAPFAFSSLVQSQSIEFTNVTIQNVQPQAFKKFPTGQLIITASNFPHLPSRSFSELTINENLLISNTTFGTVKSGAFLVHNPKRFEIIDSQFDAMEGEAFRVATRGDVLFRNVYFNTTYPGAFLGISVNFAETNIRKLFTFTSPVFETYNSDTLEINSTSFDLKLVNVYVKQSCDCARMGDIFASTNQIEEFSCLDDDITINYQYFQTRSCHLFASNATIVILVGVLVILALIVGTALWCYFKKSYRCDRYGNEKNKKKKLSMIVPDGRTYRETELHVIVERTDLLTTDL